MTDMLQKTYTEIQQRLDQLNFSKFWPEFEQEAFALYNDEKVFLKGREFVHDNRFMGNTVIDYDGQLIAIWSLSENDLQDLDELTANIVHEMFHVFQKKKGESRFPNELEMLDDSRDLAFYQLKNHEIKTLIKAWKTPEQRQNLMQDYCAFKHYHFKHYGDLLKNELYVETIEGMAEFIGLLALKELSKDKFTKKVNAYCDLLADNRYLFDIRRLGYFVGALQLFLLDSVGVDIHHSIGETNLSVFETIVGDIAPQPPIIQENDGIKELALKHQAEKESTIQAFLQEELIHIKGQARIVGFDPMNMIKTGCYVLCHHFINLEIKGERLFIKGPVLLETRNPQSYEVVAYYTLK